MNMISNDRFLYNINNRHIILFFYFEYDNKICLTAMSTIAVAKLFEITIITAYFVFNFSFHDIVAYF